MDIKRFDLILKKINTLKQNIDLTGEEISHLELELLKNYIKKLYETVTPFEEDEEFEVHKPKKKRKKKNKSVVEVKEDIEPVEEEYEEEREAEEIIEEVIEANPEEVPVPATEEIIQYDESLLALFEDQSTSELSEKLSSTPIKDMKKSMGINEKIFTINELFGGDKELFNKSMGTLNSFSSFEEAKDFLLANFATKFEWNKAVNHKKVKQFIKLVHRRYA